MFLNILQFLKIMDVNCFMFFVDFLSENEKLFCFSLLLNVYSVLWIFNSHQKALIFFLWFVTIKCHIWHMQSAYIFVLLIPIHFVQLWDSYIKQLLRSGFSFFFFSLTYSGVLENISLSRYKKKAPPKKPVLSYYTPISQNDRIIRGSMIFLWTFYFQGVFRICKIFIH